MRFLYNGAYGVTTDSNGLYYMRARYYNPDIKRFINQDIKVGDISNGQGLNRYVYCEGNPVSLIDPFGLSPEQSQEQSEESKYQWIHDSLEIAGFFCDGADVVNAFVYLAENRLKEAAFCALTAIPIIGGAVYGIAKGAKAVIQAKKAAKIASLVQDSLRMTKNAADSLDAFTDTVKIMTKHGPDAARSGSNVATAAGSSLSIALKSGENIGEAATKAGKHVDSVTSSSRVKFKTTADEVVDALKSGSKAIDYYVGPNSKILPSQYKDWIGTNIQDELLSQAQNLQLKNAIKQLYRGKSFIGDGGTADVIRFEKETGIMLGKNGGSHVQKGVDMASYIKNKILTQNLNDKDKALATRLLDDLNDALK